ncbi:MAG: hypothetical protein VB108_01165 [Anaerolineaceae bacterium]|nr:hypothetical protein [Anaerolineaceae bacterium]
MNAFADYTFYTTIFGGTSIPASAFDALALKASYEVNRLTFGRAAKAMAAIPLNTEHANAIKMTTCAVAEEMKKFAGVTGTIRNIKSESVGDHSVSYLSMEEGKALQTQAITEVVNKYLEFTGLLCRWA